MRILITNDDGVYAPGIRALAKKLEQIGEIIIAAPISEKSAVSHSLTISRPLFYKKIEVDGMKAYAIDGTPVDCVKLALDQLMIDPPDIVVSGINQGANTGINIFYSGTVAAALEASLLGFPSIAISLASYDSQDFEFAAETAENFAHYIQQVGLPPNVMININVPNRNRNEIKGFRITYQGNGRYEDSYEKRTTPNGSEYFWLSGKGFKWDQDIDADNYAVKNGWVSITPLKASLYDHDCSGELKQSLLEFTIEK